MMTLIYKNGLPMIFGSKIIRIDDLIVFYSYSSCITFISIKLNKY